MTAIIALYDGRCLICQSTRRTFLKLDWRRRLEFVDLHDATVPARFPQLDHAAMMGEIHVLADGRVYAGFAGTRRMLREMPLTFLLWLILHLPFMDSIGQRVYRWIALRRYAVNRWFGVDLDEPCADGVCKI